MRRTRQGSDRRWRGAMSKREAIGIVGLGRSRRHVESGVTCPRRRARGTVVTVSALLMYLVTSDMTRRERASIPMQNARTARVRGSSIDEYDDDFEEDTPQPYASHTPHGQRGRRVRRRVGLLLDPLLLGLLCVCPPTACSVCVIACLLLSVKRTPCFARRLPNRSSCTTTYLALPLRSPPPRSLEPCNGRAELCQRTNSFEPGSGRRIGCNRIGQHRHECVWQTDLRFDERTLNPALHETLPSHAYRFLCHWMAPCIAPGPVAFP